MKSLRVIFALLVVCSLLSCSTLESRLDAEHLELIVQNSSRFEGEEKVEILNYFIEIYSDKSYRSSVDYLLGKISEEYLRLGEWDTVNLSGWASLRIISYAAGFSTSSPSLNARPAWTSSNSLHLAIRRHRFSAS